MSFRERLRASLYARILVFIILVFGAGAVLLSIAAFHYARVAAGEAYDRLLIGGVVQVAENVFVQGGVVALEPPAAAFASLSAYDLVFYKVVDPRGLVVAGYADLAPGPASTDAMQGPVLADGTYQGQPIRVATLAKYISDATSRGWATIVLAQTCDARNALALQLTIKAGWIILAMSLLALLAGGLAVRRALAPLARIEAAISGRDTHDLRALDVETPVEIRTLVAAINLFMGRLADRIGLMQRFIADAAHQIRTPLAALDAQVDLLTSETVAERREQQIARVRDRSAALGRLTGQLLNHAMVIHRAEAVGLAPLDVAALARTVLAQAVPLSLDREVSISFVEPAEPALVEGDAISLREALSNVIHNALTHGAATMLAVRVGVDATTVTIEVVDDGPGIPPADWERVRQPFQSPTATAARPGLGLAIVADVMTAHHGSLQFRERSAAGFSVILVFDRRRNDAGR